MLDRYFDLYLFAGGRHLPLVFGANQNESGDRWIFSLKDENGVAQPVANGSIIGLKSDGNIIANAGTVDSAGRVVIEETEQMTAAAGPATFEILINNQKHGSANFTVLVQCRPGNDAEPSESDISLFQRAIDAAGQIGDTTDIVQRVEDVAAEVEAIPAYTLNYSESSGNAWITLLADGANKGNVRVLTKAIKSSTSPITSGAVYESVNLPELIDTASQAISIYINPEKYYVYGELVQLDLNILNTADDGYIHRYYVMFVSGSTPTNLSLPTGCSVDPNFTVKANHTYEVEIIQVNGKLFAKITEW